MNLTAEYKKEVLQCRSCNNIFHQSDVSKIQTERYGLDKEESVCPKCGSRTYGVIDYPVSEEKLIYNSNFPSELKLHMDQLTEEILERDRKRLKSKRAWERLKKEFTDQAGA